MRNEKEVNAINEETLSIIKEARKKLSMTLDKNRDSFMIISGVLDTSERGSYVMGEAFGGAESLRNVLEAVMMTDENLLHVIAEAVTNVIMEKEGKDDSSKGIIIGGGKVPSIIKDILQDIFSSEKETNEPKAKKPFDPNNPNIN